MKKWQIAEIHGFHIPELVSYDPELLVVEITIVSPPFVLDFVSARIEIPIDYDEEWVVRRMEEFEDDWPTVRRVVYSLAEQGIYLSDVHPGNVRCR